MEVSEEEVRAEAAKHAFRELRPLCTQLLELVARKPDDCASVLESLAQVLRNEPSIGLQACMDYILLPLTLLLDAAIACRARTDDRREHGHPWLGDKVAEHLLICLNILLDGCPCKTVPQMTMLLRKLTAGAVLSPAEASEEFRHGVVNCLRALLGALAPCHTLSCSCKYVSPSPFDILRQNPVALYEGLKNDEEDLMDDEAAILEECPLGFLHSQDMAAAVGHLLSLLLQIAEKEAAKGSTGSGKLRKDALSALRTLLLKVGTADALAFFLPGVASGLTKAVRSAMMTSRRPLASGAAYKTVGAAGSTGALEEAVRGLTELLVLVLADSRNLACLPELSDVGGETLKVESALEALQGQAQQLQENIKKLEDSGRAERSGSLEVQGGEFGAITMLGPVVGSKRIIPENETARFSLRLERNQSWLEQTTQRVESLLSESLPLLCAHPAPAVRLAVVETAAALLFSCGSTLENCTSLLLECLLALACDEWQHVASAAHAHISLLLSVASREVPDTQHSTSEEKKVSDIRYIIRSKLQKESLVGIIRRLLDRLPQAVFAGNETMSVLHARRLAAALYFVGPHAVCLSLLDTPEAYTGFVAIMTQCLSFQSAFTGSISLSSLATALRSTPLLASPELQGSTVNGQAQNAGIKVQQQSKDPDHKMEDVVASEQLPRMPPWLAPSATRLYVTLACIIRLVGRSAVSDSHGGSSLMGLVECLLETLQQTATELDRQGDLTTCVNISSGEVQRNSAASVCVLNELMYGASGVWTNKLPGLFGGISSGMASQHEQWQHHNEREVTACISECVGDILHDYLMPEIWELPVDSGSGLSRDSYGNDMQLLHVLQDNAMLQQVLVEGVGIFGMALGKSFEDEGFLALTLYALLEKLGSTNQSVNKAADIALRLICFHCGYQSVRELVVHNADYVVDSLCRQLRHLELHPQAPSFLAAILRHTGAAPDLLPLLKEPIRGIVLELEIPARRNHPAYTVPLLQALREIAKAARLEGAAMLSEVSKVAVSLKSSLQGIAIDKGLKTMENVIDSEIPDVDGMITQVQDTERRQNSVAAVATSCLHASAPLLASRDSHTCLLVLDTIEDGVAGLADIEAAFPHLQAQRTAVEEFLKRCGDGHGDAEEIQPFGSRDDESVRNNILLPSMNRIWPHLVSCLRQSQPSVIERALAVIASATANCGGHFFSRRMEKDALPLLLKLLHEGPLIHAVHTSDMLRPKTSSELMLLRRQGRDYGESGTSLAVVLRVQEAVLKCISAIAGGLKSAAAMDTVYKPLVALVVGLACKQQALFPAAADALFALSHMDADLVWLLVADLAYGGEHKHRESPGEEFPGFDQVFPVLSSPKDALWVQYSRFDADASVERKAAWELLAKLEQYISRPSYIFLCTE